MRGWKKAILLGKDILNGGRGEILTTLPLSEKVIIHFWEKGK